MHIHFGAKQDTGSLILSQSNAATVQTVIECWKWEIDWEVGDNYAAYMEALKKTDWWSRGGLFD